MFFILLAVFLLVAHVASIECAKLEVKHAWKQIPEGWELHDTPSTDHLVPLRIGLKQNRLDELISTLYRVSDPLHPQYGQHLSRLYDFITIYFRSL